LRLDFIKIATPRRLIWIDVEKSSYHHLSQNATTLNFQIVSQWRGLFTEEEIKLATQRLSVLG
jgi:hypothetical protein